VVVQGARRRLAFAAVAGTSTWVFLDGRVSVFDRSSTTRAGEGPGADALPLSTPMPATVTAIHVTPGTRVTSGDVVLVLEAMKMELPIRAPRDGRVRAVACHVGDLVQPGVVLVDLE
jgi:biotin carboxyl carrier protein